MFFTKLGQVIAWLLVIVGGSQAMLAFAVAFTTVAPRYFGTKPTGEAIDAGMLYVLIGVAVGIVAEISRSVAAKAEVKKQELK